MNTNRVNQPTGAPTRKVVGFFGGGAVAALSMGLVAIFAPEVYARVPPGFEGAISTTIGFVAAYFTRDTAVRS